ncbi:hypothetical protein B0I26_1042 [Anoxybacillus vitaminiphilus]|uniref:Uncharacterized protein n=1 Tax=Paranoxybacillus vitaminiphilus TaxID=581036 RepID=A0A327YIR7_9BACL|nr:hypothetical protein [Anoxybacillus vitaminiphilus]RAK20351.1 hypothetical protein B0I26_1042 [Anoxybacillus vitaminiphilus]
MNENVWEFMGIQRTDQTESDRLLTSIMNRMMSSLSHFTNLYPSDFSSFAEMVKYGKAINNDHSYFWDWMDEYGIGYIKTIGKTTLPDTEETLNFLSYRQLLLEMDIENGIASNLFLSISELLTAVNEFIRVHLEPAVTYVEHDFGIFEEPIICQGKLNSEQENIEWEFLLSPADLQQGFCYKFY